MNQLGAPLRREGLYASHLTDVLKGCSRTRPAE